MHVVQKTNCLAPVDSCSLQVHLETLWAPVMLFKPYVIIFDRQSNIQICMCIYRLAPFFPLRP